jgi:hypothetical protein
MNAFLLSVANLFARQAFRLAHRTIDSDMPDLGEWRGEFTIRLLDSVEGKVLGIPMYSTRVYLVELPQENPLRFFHKESGIEYSPCKLKFASDLGSTPWLVHGTECARLTPDAFPRTYILHDAAYMDARIRVRKDGHDWTEVELDRREADILLYWGLSAEPITPEPTRLECQAVYRGVRVGGSIPWGEHRRRQGL